MGQQLGNKGRRSLAGSLCQWGSDVVRSKLQENKESASNQLAFPIIISLVYADQITVKNSITHHCLVAIKCNGLLWYNVTRQIEINWSDNIWYMWYNIWQHVTNPSCSSVSQRWRLKASRSMSGWTCRTWPRHHGMNSTWTAQETCTSCEDFMVMLCKTHLLMRIHDCVPFCTFFF